MEKRPKPKPLPECKAPQELTSKIAVSPTVTQTLKAEPAMHSPPLQASA